MSYPYNQLKWLAKNKPIKNRDMITDNKQETYEETNEPLPNTLYNRLQDDVSEDLDRLATRFPTIYKIIKDYLTEHDNYFSVPFDCAYMMNVYLKVDLNNFSRIFKHD